MSRRIYYTDPACRRFDAVVTRALQHEGRPAVALDRTAFYPTSGGQPHDTGRLGSASVVEAIDLDGDVIHVMSEPLAEGRRVEGEIDWERRFDHMQQHTGQHVLSAAFDRLFANRTMSFHMGADVSTVDLAAEMTSAQIESAVDEANRVVWEDVPVSIRFATPEEAARLALRKEPVRGGTLRLIEIAGFDLSACGGTHVSRTGAIGLVAVIGAERFRGGARVTFVCGRRALAAVRTYRDAVSGTIRTLSVAPSELPAAVERLQADGRDLRKTLSRLQAQLAGHEAASLAAGADTVAGMRRVAAVLNGWDASGLKAIATALAGQHTTCAVLVSSSSSPAIVVARAAGVAVDASAVLRQLLERFGGRGGGKTDLAQGGGLNASPDAVLAMARQLLDDALTTSGSS